MKKSKSVQCPDVLRHICDELDTKLTSDQCRDIKRHLAKCRNCTAYLDSLKKTIKLYSASPDARLPDKARRQLFAVLKIKG